MDFCSKVAVKLLLKGVDTNKTSPLSYNAIMNMVAAGSSGYTLDQILRLLKHKTIEEVNSESSTFAKITDVVETEGGEAPAKDVDEEVKGFTMDHVFSYHKRHADKGEAPTISFLNGVWVNQRYSLKDSFKELMQDIYKAKAENIDCENPGLVVQQINEWASASTKGLIKNVLTEQHIKRDTTLILGNALYFKGSWEEPFKKTSTRCKPFYLLNGESIDVPFMTGNGKYSHKSYPSFHKSFQGFQVARIPYSAGGDIHRKYAMYIFLPNDKDGLTSLLSSVDSNPNFFGQHCDPLKECSSRVDIFWIPKFKFSCLTESPEIMKGMGLTLPFDMQKAELNEMIKERDVFVSSIIQKAVIEVNEEGTEAAAVTFATMLSSSSMYAPPPPTRFIADHPFLFIIREENSGFMLFTGTVLNSLEA